MPVLVRAALALLVLLMEMFPSSNAEGQKEQATASFT